LKQSYGNLRKLSHRIDRKFEKEGTLVRMWVWISSLCVCGKHVVQMITNTGEVKGTLANPNAMESLAGTVDAVMFAVTAEDKNLTERHKDLENSAYHGAHTAHRRVWLRLMAR
jgi:hypothetical protein